MAFEVSGKIEVIYDTNQVTDRFKKREFVLTIQDGMYPEYIKMQLTQDRCDLLDAYKVGDEVKVSFNLKGRPYTKGDTTTYFTNIDAWKIDSLNSGADAAASNSPSANDEPGAPLHESPAPDDELPF